MLNADAELAALLQSAKCGDRKKMWQRSVAQAPSEGLWLEFGVYKGASLDFFSKRCPGTMYGFDSAEGLPEDWDLAGGQPYGGIGLRPKGSYKGQPIGKAPTAQLVTGWFEDTLPDFLTWSGNEGRNVALLHIDCDIYSSTATVLECLESRIVPGTVIIFDEIYNYPNFAQGEMRAWLELLERKPMDYQWLHHVRRKSAASLKIL